MFGITRCITRILLTSPLIYFGWKVLAYDEHFLTTLLGLIMFCGGLYSVGFSLFDPFYIFSRYFRLYRSQISDINNTIYKGRIFDNRVYAYMYEKDDSDELYFHTIGRYFIENAYLYGQCQKHIEEGRFDDIVNELNNFYETKPIVFADPVMEYKNDNLLVAYAKSTAYTKVTEHFIGFAASMQGLLLISIGLCFYLEQIVFSYF